MEKVELLAGLGQINKAGSKAKSKGADGPPGQEEAISPAEPVTADVEAFWKGGELPDDLLGEVHVSPMEAALIKRLGNFPFWRASRLLHEYLAPVYLNASRSGMDIFLRETAPGN